MTPADAVTNFAAWLSTRNEPTSFGRFKDSSVAAERATEFLEANELGSPEGQEWVNPDGGPKVVEVQEGGFANQDSQDTDPETDYLDG